ncbi:dual specificity phosphatase, catalytic domain protein [Ancylostoma duodenale]|uniref:protein-tyrosine-phosphatase n=1 Tax=Ancylostoma duodenale TaxID=51022 RepID=A0A0C2GEB3_9BILA|nr:dual specificity phosphatase, catalytic domain protein [Ancylostoma duodenale]
MGYEEDMIDKITDHVFISGAGDVLLGGSQLRKLEITHVLTVSAVAIPMDKRLPNIEYHFLFAMDLPNQDLLVGASRSVTMVAAYIMQKFKFPADKAVEFIKKSRPIAFPNEGFFTQLQIFEKLGYKLDEATLSRSRDYKDWCIASGNVPNHGSDERAATFVRDVDVHNNDSARGSKFRCGKCRHVLFFGEHLTRHKRCDGERCGFGYLIEPMKWMDVTEYEGKINCPSCDSKLGNYSWGGRQCQGEPGARCNEHGASSSYIVTPWVHLHRAKVDEVSSRTAIEPHAPPPGIPSVIIS